MTTVNGEISMKMLLAMGFWVQLSNDEPTSDLQRCIHGDYVQS